MKLSSQNIKSIAFSAFVGIASALSFENTAPLLISNAAFYDTVKFKSMDSIANVKDLLSTLSDEFCFKHPNERLFYLRVPGLGAGEIPSELINIANVATEHVVYDIPSSELFIGKSCSQVQILNMKDIDGSYNLDEHTNVAVIDFVNAAELYKTIDQLTAQFNVENVIIQGLPSFETPGNSWFDKSQQQLQNLLKSNSKKREELDYGRIEQELNETFEEVNELLNDELVEIYEKTNIESKSTLSHSNKKIVIGDSLFDKYSFFTNGIWMCTIVFLFLTWLLSMALSWLSSLQVSYGAFDKPFDFEKKMQ